MPADTDREEPKLKELCEDDQIQTEAASDSALKTDEVSWNGAVTMSTLHDEADTEDVFPGNGLVRRLREKFSQLTVESQQTATHYHPTTTKKLETVHQIVDANGSDNIICAVQSAAPVTKHPADTNVTCCTASKSITVAATCSEHSSTSVEAAGVRKGRFVKNYTDSSTSSNSVPSAGCADEADELSSLEGIVANARKLFESLTSMTSRQSQSAHEVDSSLKPTEDKPDCSKMLATGVSSLKLLSTLQPPDDADADADADADDEEEDNSLSAAADISKTQLNSDNDLETLAQKTPAHLLPPDTYDTKTTDFDSTLSDSSTCSLSAFTGQLASLEFSTNAFNRLALTASDLPARRVLSGTTEETQTRSMMISESAERRMSQRVCKRSASMSDCLSTRANGSYDPGSNNRATRRHVRTVATRSSGHLVQLHARQHSFDSASWSFDRDPVDPSAAGVCSSVIRMGPDLDDVEIVAPHSRRDVRRSMSMTSASAADRVGLASSADVPPQWRERSLSNVNLLHRDRQHNSSSSCGATDVAHTTTSSGSPVPPAGKRLQRITFDDDQQVFEYPSESSLFIHDDSSESEADSFEAENGEPAVHWDDDDSNSSDDAADRQQTLQSCGADSSGLQSPAAVSALVLLPVDHCSATDFSNDSTAALFF